MTLAVSLPALAQTVPERSPGRPEFRDIRLGLAHVGIARHDGDLVATRWLGTGFLVDRDCTVVAAKHIVQGAEREQLVVRFLHPTDPDAVRTFAARVIWEDPAKDVMLLRFGGERVARRLCRSELRPMRPAAGFDATELTGRSVLVAGFPVLEGEQPRDLPILKRGLVASAEFTWDGIPMLLLDMTGVPGFSGSPVILEDTGEVVGIVFGPGRTRRQYDLEWATPFTAEDYRRGVERSAGEPAN